jgi:Big-like domain-containing protein
VALIYNGTILGTARVRVVHGVATARFTVEFFGPGSYTFTAEYLGSTQFQGSSSNSVTVNL